MHMRTLIALGAAALVVTAGTQAQAGLIDPPATPIISYDLGTPSDLLPLASLSADLTESGSATTNSLILRVEGTDTTYGSDPLVGFYEFQNVDNAPDFISFTDTGPGTFTFSAGFFLSNTEIPLSDLNDSLGGFGPQSGPLSLGPRQSADISALPLPGGLPLFGSGLLGLVALAWRRANRKTA